MLQIPVQPVPSQQLQCVMNSQNVELAIYQNNYGLFVDITSNGAVVSSCTLALNGVPLNPFSYSTFQGNLLFVDTQGVDDPTYTGLGSRFQLVYLDPAEYALAYPAVN